MKPLKAPNAEEHMTPPIQQTPHDPSDLGFALPEPARLSLGRGMLVVGGILVLLGGAFIASYLPKRHDRMALEAGARDAVSSMPHVEAVAPKLISSDRALTLPGSVQALEETVVFARQSGYLRRWYKDLGDKVAEGELLAEIETPELDQQILQARAESAQADASLAQAKANAEFSKANLARYQKVVAQGIASQEDYEKTKAQAGVDAATVTVALANIEAQHANIQRLTQLKSFTRVVAPFAGTVTARTVERGALVTAGNASPLFKVAATDPIRVFVQVPQDSASSVTVGSPVKVTVHEFPGRSFDGKVARAAGALDPATRTMTTEVRVPNPNGELMVGIYAQVSLVLPTPHQVFEVPATALMNDAKGLRVAVIDSSAHIRLLPVVVERDTGATIEIASGLDASMRIVKLPSVALTDGVQVDVAK